MALSWIDLAVLVLATLRLQKLWFEEVARPVRERLVRFGGRRAFLAQCPLCISVWSSIVTIGLWFAHAGLVDLVLALSAASLMLDSWMTRPPATALIAQQLAQLNGQIAQIKIEQVDVG